MATNSLLIVGVDGYIGNYIYNNRLVLRGWQCYGTSKKDFLETKDIQYLNLLDLKHSQGTKALLKKCDVIIFVAGKTSASFANCYPELSHKINIEGLQTIVRLTEEHAKFVYLSSSRCFDGNYPYYTEVDQAMPKDEYGQQKIDAEALILSQRENSVILRLSKVINPNEPFLHSASSSLCANRPIEMSNNKFFSPISAEMILFAINRCLSFNIKGITHFSPIQPLTYFDFFRRFAQFKGLPVELVRTQKDYRFTHKYDSLKSSQVFADLQSDLITIFKELT